MDKKDLKKTYLQTGTQAGVYKVECLENGRILLGSSTNAPGILNSHRFQLKMGTHRSTELQEDWNRFGESAFSFEMVDTLKKKDDPAVDINEELKELETLWRDKLSMEGREFYQNP